MLLDEQYENTASWVSFAARFLAKIMAQAGAWQPEKDYGADK